MIDRRDVVWVPRDLEPAIRGHLLPVRRRRAHARAVGPRPSARRTQAEYEGRWET